MTLTSGSDPSPAAAGPSETVIAHNDPSPARDRVLRLYERRHQPINIRVALPSLDGILGALDRGYEVYDGVRDTVEELRELPGEVRDRVSDGIDELEERGRDLAEDVGETVGDGVDTVRDGVDTVRDSPYAPWNW